MRTHRNTGNRSNFLKKKRLPLTFKIEVLLNGSRRLYHYAELFYTISEHSQDVIEKRRANIFLLIFMLIQGEGDET